MSDDTFDNPEYEPWYKTADELTQLYTQDAEDWKAAIADPQARAVWNWKAGWANHFGLGAETPIAEIRTKLAGYELSQQPEAFYDELVADDRFADLSVEDQDALLPENFKGSAAKKLAAMSRKFGELTRGGGSFAEEDAEAAVSTTGRGGRSSRAASASAGAGRDPLAAIAAYNRALDAGGPVPEKVSKAADAALKALRDER